MLCRESALLDVASEGMKFYKRSMLWFRDASATGTGIGLDTAVTVFEVGFG
jgi:hypothetical protein